VEVDTSDSDFSTNEEVEEFLNKFEKVLYRNLYTLHQVEQPHPLLNLNLEFKKKY
jgi:hypothetical protein